MKLLKKSYNAHKIILFQSLSWKAVQNPITDMNFYIK
jgi:hypothetical protein